MDVTIGAYIIAFFFAMNIGASGTAAAMGPAYGSGAIKRRFVAMLLVGGGAFVGALFGSEVVKTIGAGVIPESFITTEVAIIILLGATFTLFFANWIGIPLSTSEVVVGSLVGVGLAFQSLHVSNLFTIFLCWLIVPVVAFGIAYMLGRGIKNIEPKWTFLHTNSTWKKVLTALVIMTGLVESFAAGMNNVSNAVGPLVGASLISMEQALLFGGLFLGLGAMVFGSKVLETNGKKITRLSLLQGSAVSFTGGSLVIVASVFGIPVPLTQVTTSAIIGIGASNHGFQLREQMVLKQIIHVWVLSPVVSVVVSYSLMLIFIHKDVYTLFIMITVSIATLGSVRFLQLIKKERQSTHDGGSGI